MKQASAPRQAAPVSRAAAGAGAAPAAGNASDVEITVCYARPEGAWLSVVRLPAGATVAQALSASGFLDVFPHVDPEQAGVGIYGKLQPLDHVLRDHDRVEVYRPLAFDPMESRRRRAEHKARKPGRRPPSVQRHE